VLAAAVVVTIVVGLAILAPQLRLQRAKQAPPPDRPPCTAERRTDCVGGTMPVIVAPAPPAAASR
jgi:hypothetical protein